VSFADDARKRSSLDFGNASVKEGFLRTCPSLRRHYPDQVQRVAARHQRHLSRLPPAPLGTQAVCDGLARKASSTRLGDLQSAFCADQIFGK